MLKFIIKCDLPLVSVHVWVSIWVSIYTCELSGPYPGLLLLAAYLAPVS